MSKAYGNDSDILHRLFNFTAILFSGSDCEMSEYVPIEESVDISTENPSVTERYYTKRYYDDHCVLFHSNRICLITLAQSHPILKEKKKVMNIRYHASDGVNRLKNHVTGKGKHGAQQLQPLSPLCHVLCEDGSTYIVRTCINGKLVEVNETLLQNPGLLTEKPYAEGYIAIVLPTISGSKENIASLLTEEEHNLKESS